jgi:hypothetical protein
MIDYKNNELIDPRNQERMKILRWEVWFKTSLGFYTELPAAVIAMETGNTYIMPVPVAIGETYYEPI